MPDMALAMKGYALDREGPKASENASNPFPLKNNENILWRSGIMIKR